VRESLDFVLAGPTSCGEVLFQAAINFLQSSLSGTIRLIVSPGSDSTAMIRWQTRYKEREFRLSDPFCVRPDL
jgi:hypothetical protein